MSAVFSSMPSLFHEETVVWVNAALIRVSHSFNAALMRSVTLCQRVRVKLNFMFCRLSNRDARMLKGEYAAIQIKFVENNATVAYTRQT